ncbi:hypothetical protein V6N12_073941 [Hibiscus sabdariffa]|uniref:Uncharacterized protein n=1 Tax=Hibiscus sabdariffa TaxID=183260 RepID=A0ABR1Z7H8_9ROSI
MVHRQSVLPNHCAVPGAAYMSANAECGTDTGGKAMDFAVLPDVVIKLADCGAGADPCGFVGHVDVYGAEIEHVEYEKGLVEDVREPLVVVTTAADFEAETELLGTGNGGRDVGFFLRSDDEERFRGGRRVETRVSNVSTQNGSIREIVLRVNDGGSFAGGDGFAKTLDERLMDGIGGCR